MSEILRIPDPRIFAIVVCAAAPVGLWWFLTRSKRGWSLRAISQDREAAALQGININRTSLIAIGISAGLAGLAGALMAPLTNMNPHMGHKVIITACFVTIVGGVGSLSGAVLAAYLYAMLH